MENLLDKGEFLTSQKNAVLPKDAKRTLETSARWAKYLGMTSICIAVLLLFALMMLGISYPQFDLFTLQTDGTAVFGYFLNFLRGLTYILTVVFMFRIADKLQEAFTNDDQYDFEEGLQNVKYFLLVLLVLTSLATVATLLSVYELITV